MKNAVHTYIAYRVYDVALQFNDFFLFFFFFSPKARKSALLLYNLSVELTSVLAIWCSVCICWMNLFMYTWTFIYLHLCICIHGLPRWLSDKESPCQCRRHRFDPWVRKISSKRKWQTTLVFLPENLMDKGAQQARAYGITNCRMHLGTK